MSLSPEMFGNLSVIKRKFRRAASFATTPSPKPLKTHSFPARNY